MKPATFTKSFHTEDEWQKMHYHKLGETDMVVSKLGLGGSGFGNVFGEVDEAESQAVVKLALQKGINYIDTAPWYGQGRSEEVLGRALKDIPRNAYYIATKVGRYEKEAAKMFDFSYERALRSVDESLNKLGLQYADLIQVHDVEFAPDLDVVLNETLPALQRIKAEGKARYIGITGYSLSHLETIVTKSKVKIDTVLSYCRFTLNDASLLQYKGFFRKRGIGIINASIMSMGLLTNNEPPPWHPAKLFRPEIVQACEEAVQYCNDHGVDISRLAAHFSYSLLDSSTNLTTMLNTKQVEANLGVMLSQLSAHEKEVMTHIQQTYMKPLNNANWEGLEVKLYREELKSNQGKSALG